MSNLDKIQNEYYLILNNLEADQWQILVNDEWTIKDCIAHFLGWEILAVEIINDYSLKNKFSMNFNEYGKFNISSISKFKKYSVKKLLVEWEKYQKILKINLKNVSKERFSYLSSIFDWIDESRKHNHYTYHLKQIKDKLNTNNKGVI